MEQKQDSSQEIEVKFHVSSLAKLEFDLVSKGATCIQERTHEINIRFDTSDRSLEQVGRVLRLRKDIGQTLTYKGPSLIVDGVRVRQEIELKVGDFDQPQRLMEVLGYIVLLKYEKYRKVMQYNNTLIMLDELPYGNFIEIEAHAPSAISQVTQLLDLNWEYRIFDSYTDLFYRLKREYGWDFQDLTFENLSLHDFDLARFDIQPADIRR
jgi:adenylate cyclase, class 2